eukprot:TRINITY_DN1434_c0_g1_i3.p1 TRINITY_DN1434_c0_g1~~TRINITY_DN1434_c0_g1_i3.p1  ORF type:complete len:177 (+),score=37.44 TRINITY_DN1434_c0_g1_i3:81-611(+)
MEIITVETGSAVLENCYIVFDSKTREAVIFDPGFDAKKILDEVKSKELLVKSICCTHGHFDHCFSVSEIQKEIDVPFLIHENELPILKGIPARAAVFGLSLPVEPTPSAFLTDGQEIRIGESVGKVMFSPGHSPGGVIFFFEKENIMIVGDSVIAGSHGRTDLIGELHRFIVKLEM